MYHNVEVPALTTQTHYVSQDAAVTTSSAGSFRSEKAVPRGHRRSLSLEDTGSSVLLMSPVALEPARSEKRPRKRGQRKNAEPVVRKVMFVHVRINRFHCRGTYHVRCPRPLMQACRVLKGNLEYKVIKGSIHCNFQIDAAEKQFNYPLEAAFLKHLLKCTHSLHLPCRAGL